MGLPLRREPDAGRTTSQHYQRLRQRWRGEMRLPLLIVLVLSVPSSILIWRYFPLGQFSAGMWVGGSLGMVMWIWDDPPEYIARWKRGADGERRTAKALRQLETRGWRVFHDRDSEFGNLDHVVIGPPGIFLLETKNLSGVITYEPNGLTTHHQAAPRNDFTYSRLDGTMRGSAFRLKQKVEEATQLSTWVQAVVAIWGQFPAGVVEADRVTYVAGDRLAEWLASREPKLSPRDQRLVELALDAELVAPPAPAIA